MNVHASACRVRLFLATCLAVPAFAGSCQSNPSDDASEVGEVRLSLSQVPVDLGCLRVVAVGAARTTEKLVNLTPGSSSANIRLSGLPLGKVSFSGEAFAETCKGLTPASVPSWVADAVDASVVAGNVADVALSFRRNGRAQVNADFDGTEPACTPAGGACLESAECCNHSCTAGICSSGVSFSAPPGFLIAHKRTSDAKWVVAQLGTEGALIREFGALETDEFRPHLAVVAGTLFRTSASYVQLLQQFAPDGSLLRSIVPGSSSNPEANCLAATFSGDKVFFADIFGGTNVIRRLEDPATGAQAQFVMLYYDGIAGITDMVMDSERQLLYALSQTSPTATPPQARVAKVNASGTVTYLDSPDLNIPYVADIGSVTVDPASGSVYAATTTSIVRWDAGGVLLGSFGVTPDLKPSIDVGQDGNIYYARFETGAILVYSPSGALLRTIALPNSSRVGDIWIIRP